MNKRILLVEYANPTIEIIKEILSHPIFQLTVINEGDAAKELLTRESYDLLITAAMLPKFHGFNLSQFTGTNYPDTRIIIISEIYKGMDYKHQATTQYKADDFFEKPLDKTVFKERVFQLLGIQDDQLSESSTPVTTTEIPIPVHDTKKIPTFPTLEALESEGKKMTSQDLFGDIIDAVQEGGSTYEIKLNTDSAPDNSKPDIPPVTRVLNQKDFEKHKQTTSPPPPPPQTMNPMTQMLKVEEVEPNVVNTETKPEEIFSLQLKKDKLPPVTQEIPASTQEFAATTQEIPLVTQVIKKEDLPSSPLTTQKIDMDFLDLIKSDVKDENAEKGKKRSKQIEDDISKKFEETLSGLGLGPGSKSSPSSDSAPSKPTPPTPPKASPPPPQPKPEPTDDVGGYDILGLIARGGMAEIYKAKKKGVKGFEKLIALKKILGGYGGDDKYIEMFVDEAKIAAQLTHPNIVQIYDLGKKDDHYFIAMEYVSGKDLRDILHRLSDANTLMPEELAIYLVTKILGALNYAHAARDGSGTPLDIVHRDVSPPNILVSYNGDIKLTDFGVSKASIKMHHTVAGALKGKLLYMSPEQAKGDISIDYRSDIYSVAIILFELLTGQKLFLGTSEIGTLKKVQDGRIHRPSQIRKEISSQLEEIVLKGLAKNPDNRYQKASDMIKALDGYMIKNYNNMPEVSHLSHFIYTLFKDDINKEQIKVNLKPIPYSIKRKTLEPPPAPSVPPRASAPSPQSPSPQSPAPPSPPQAEKAPPVPPPVDRKPSSPEASKAEPVQPSAQVPEPLFENKSTPDTPPIKTAPVSLPEQTPAPPADAAEKQPQPQPAAPSVKPSSPPPPISEEHFPVPPEAFPEDEDSEGDILELTEADQIDNDSPEPLFMNVPSIPDSLPEDAEAADDSGGFQPIIEINFDEDPAKAGEPPVMTEASPVAAANDFEAPIENKSTKKKSNMLLIAVIIIILLAAAIIYFLMNSNSSDPGTTDTGTTSSTPNISQTREDDPSTLPGKTNPEQSPTGDLTNSQNQTGDQSGENSGGRQENIPGNTGEGVNTGTQKNQQPVNDTEKTNSAVKIDKSGKNKKNQTTQSLPSTETEKPAGTKKKKTRKDKSRKEKSKQSLNDRKKEQSGKKEQRDNRSQAQGNTNPPVQKKVSTEKKATGNKKTEQSQNVKPETKPEKQSESGSESDPGNSGGKGLIPAVRGDNAAQGTQNPAQKTPDAKPQVTPEKKPVIQTPKPEPIKTGTIVGLTEVDTQPVPISDQVKIPRGIRRLMISNQKVMASFLVDHNGKVETVRLIQKSSMKKLNAKIIEAIKKWTFKPATKNNVRVKVWKNRWITIAK